MPLDNGRRLKLAILGNELFSTDVGRMGGFGWAVQQVSRCFRDDPGLGVDVVILMGERVAGKALPATLHGSPVLWRTGSRFADARRLWSERIDLVLCIDYRSNYRFFFYALPRVPFVVWARDPWDAHDRKEIATLRIPGQESEQPRGTNVPNTNLRRVARLSAMARRQLLLATTSPFLTPKVADAYGFDPGPVHVLPNIVDTSFPVSKSSRPTIVSLARLDPTKRPWLFMSLAKRFPDVDFIVMGQSHFKGSGAWQPSDLPGNVRLLGHTNEQQKREVLSAAWLLANTSIHEGLSVSFLEALACETPIVALVDPERVVSRFGLCVGQHLGTGVDALPALERAVSELLGDQARRSQLGKDGRAWVSEHHNRAQFLKAFSGLCALAGTDARPAWHSA